MNLTLLESLFPATRISNGNQKENLKKNKNKNKKLGSGTKIIIAGSFFFFFKVFYSSEMGWNSHSEGGCLATSGLE